MPVVRSWPLRRLAEARIAVMTLTRLPVGRIADPVPAMAASAWAFPLVGLLVGAIGALAYGLAAMAHLPPAFSALTAIAVGLMLTGALHEDGLADTADGLGGGRTRADKLAIMRDSHIGTYGVLALILAVGLRGVSMASLDAAIAVCALIALAAASRAAMVIALAAMPPARADGLGNAAADVGLVPCAVAVAIGVAALIALIAAAPIVIVAMLAAGLLLAVLAWRAIGGQTGDILGALQQITEIAGWTAILAWHANVA